MPVTCAPEGTKSPEEKEYMPACLYPDGERPEGEEVHASRIP